MLKTIKRFATENSGATAIEYGLIALGIAIAIVVSVGVLGTDVAAIFTTVGTNLK